MSDTASHINEKLRDYEQRSKVFTCVIMYSSYTNNNALLITGYFYYQGIFKIVKR